MFKIKVSVMPNDPCYVWDGLGSNARVRARPKYRAAVTIDGGHEIHGTGRSPDEAVGSLVRNHLEHFQVIVTAGSVLVVG